MRRTLVVAMLAGLSLTVLAAEPQQGSGAGRGGPAPGIASTSELVLDGGGFSHQTVSLAKVTGDWFAIDNDAHATIDLTGGPGGAVLLNLQWDGKQPAHVITHDTNSDMGGAHSTVYLHMSGPAPFDATFQPDGADAFTITVKTMTDKDLEAAVAGSLTGSGRHVSVAGKLVLHRDVVPVPVRSGDYVACDPVVHDKFVGAQNRSSSECEAKFDADVRRAIDKAFARVAPELARDQWVVKTRPEPKPLVAAVRHSEDKPFQLGAGTTGYHLAFQIDPNGERARAYAQQMDEVTKTLADMKKLTDFAYAMQGAVTIDINVAINQSSASLGNYTGDHLAMDVPGASAALFSSHVQALTGGGVDSSRDAALILVGRWGPLAVTKESDGGERVSYPARLDPAAPKLSLQNVRIRMEANLKLVNDVARLIDYDAFKPLLR